MKFSHYVFSSLSTLSVPASSIKPTAVRRLVFAAIANSPITLDRMSPTDKERTAARWCYSMFLLCSVVVREIPFMFCDVH